MSTDMFPQGFIDYMTERAKPRRERLHRWFERKTGLIFGVHRVGPSAETTSGYPLRKAWLVIAPQTDGFCGTVQVRGKALYAAYYPEVRR